MRRLLLLALALSGASATAQTPAALATIDSLARAAVAAHGLPSLVVGVSVGGVRTVRGYGAVGDAAPTAGTPYEIGSVTKLVTALALADAVVRGDLALETPVQTLLPASVHLRVANRPITLADLATHTAGLPRLPAPFTPASILDPYADYTTAALMRFVGSVAPDPAGARYAYSNVGVGLLAWLLARHDSAAEGADVEALLLRRVLGPLGLTATGTATPDGLAPPTTGSGVPIAPWAWTDALVGAGGLRSTAADLLTLAEAAARPDRAPALADAMRLTLAPRYTDAGRVRLGLAWHLLPAAPGAVEVAFHNGATFGSAAFVGAAPRQDVCVVLLTNRGLPGEVDALAGQVLAALGAR